MGRKTTGIVSALALLFSTANPVSGDENTPALPDCAQPLQPSLKAATYCLEQNAWEKESRAALRGINGAYEQAVADAQAAYMGSLTPLRQDYYWASGEQFSVIKATGAALHDTMAARLQDATSTHEEALKAQQETAEARRAAIINHYLTPDN